MVYEQRTPLMVAAMYGSIDILNCILSLSIIDVNRSCGNDKSTALHYAASGGSTYAVDAVKLLLGAGADPNLVDVDGHRPFDVITVSPKQNDVKLALEELLAGQGSVSDRILRVSTTTSNSDAPPPSSSSLCSSDSPPSPMKLKFDDPMRVSYGSEKKEYPIDPSLPDIKNSIYATDEFRMYSFKIRPCSRAYSHDWTECPFVHPSENARRRDPRKYHYSCVPCPDFRKGTCVNTLMGFLSVGFILLSIELASAKMARVAVEEFASLLTQLMNLDLCMSLLVLLFPRPVLALQV